MSEYLKVKATRVKYLHYGQKPLKGAGSVPSKYPDSGVVIEVDHPAARPVYLSNATLDELRALPDDGVLEFDGWREED